MDLSPFSFHRVRRISQPELSGDAKKSTRPGSTQGTPSVRRARHRRRIPVLSERERGKTGARFGEGLTTCLKIFSLGIFFLVVRGSRCSERSTYFRTNARSEERSKNLCVHVILLVVRNYAGSTDCVFHRPLRGNRSIHKYNQSVTGRTFRVARCGILSIGWRRL